MKAAPPLAQTPWLLLLSRKTHLIAIQGPQVFAECRAPLDLFVTVFTIAWPQRQRNSNKQEAKAEELQRWEKHSRVTQLVTSVTYFWIASTTVMRDPVKALVHYYKEPRERTSGFFFQKKLHVMKTILLFFSHLLVLKFDIPLPLLNHIQKFFNGFLLC